MSPHVERLTERQLELWFAGYGRPDLPDEMVNWPMTVHPTPGQTLLVHRGFVERVASFTDVFLDLAGGLFARQPVTHVRLLDREPYAMDRRRSIWLPPSVRDDLGRIPPGLWPYLFSASEEPCDIGMGFWTEVEAAAHLSWACVRYGRAEAGNGEPPA